MTRRRGGRSNRGATAVELAILLSSLFLLAIAFGVFDFALLFQRAAVVQDCAANGAAAGVALGPSATEAARDSAIRAVVDEIASPAGVAPIQKLSPLPTVASSSGTDEQGFPYLEVTVTYTPDGSVGAIWSTGATPISRKVRLMMPPQ